MFSRLTTIFSGKKNIKVHKSVKKYVKTQKNLHMFAIFPWLSEKRKSAKFFICFDLNKMDKKFYLKSITNQNVQLISLVTLQACRVKQTMKILKIPSRQAGNPAVLAQEFFMSFVIYLALKIFAKHGRRMVSYQHSFKGQGS